MEEMGTALTGVDIDDIGRRIEYIRISVTDRCNYRCIYCMPEDGVCDEGHSNMMSLEEIAHFIEVASTMGIKHVRLTGGEPTVRKGIVDLVAMIRAIPAIETISMTTNGVLLPKLAKPLKYAGLDRVNISLDTLDPEMFHMITRRGYVEEATNGIQAAIDAGLAPVKINCVVVKSLNQDIYSFAKMSYDQPLHMRFIEYMPIGNVHDDPANNDVTSWTAADTIPSEDLIALISKKGIEDGIGPLIASEGPTGKGPAKYYKFADGQGTVGFITAMSNHFCAQCNRMRVTADGCIRPCLFNDMEFSMLEALKSGDDDALRAVYQEALGNKPDEHHHHIGTQRAMSRIGG